MAFQNIESIVELARAAGRRKTVAVAAAESDHVLEGVVRAEKEGIISPLLVGDREKILAILDGMGESVDPARIIESPDILASAKTAVQLVKSGDADFIMKGKLNTADLLRAVLNKQDGLPHGPVITHMSMMNLPAYHKVLVLNDVAVIPDPTLEQKIGMIKIVTETMHRLGYGDDLKVGVVCSAETPNMKIREMAEAVELKKLNQAGEIRGCIVEGPISIDLALSREAAELKGYDSPVAGDVDLLLFPNITSGSCFIKAITLFAGATPVGMTVGASCPLSISSRSATSDFKFYSLALAAAASN